MAADNIMIRRSARIANIQQRRAVQTTHILQEAGKNDQTTNNHNLRNRKKRQLDPNDAVGATDRLRVPQPPKKRTRFDLNPQENDIGSEEKCDVDFLVHPSKNEYTFGDDDNLERLPRTWSSPGQGLRATGSESQQTPQAIQKQQLQRDSDYDRIRLNNSKYHRIQNTFIRDLLKILKEDTNTTLQKQKGRQEYPIYSFNNRINALKTTYERSYSFEKHDARIFQIEKMVKQLEQVIRLRQQSAEFYRVEEKQREWLEFFNIRHQHIITVLLTAYESMGRVLQILVAKGGEARARAKGGEARTRSANRKSGDKGSGFQDTLALLRDLDIGKRSRELKIWKQDEVLSELEVSGDADIILDESSAHIKAEMDESEKLMIIRRTLIFLETVTTTIVSEWEEGYDGIRTKTDESETDSFSIATEKFAFVVATKAIEVLININGNEAGKSDISEEKDASSGGLKPDQIPSHPIEANRVVEEIARLSMITYTACHHISLYLSSVGLETGLSEISGFGVLSNTIEDLKSGLSEDFSQKPMQDGFWICLTDIYKALNIWDPQNALDIYSDAFKERYNRYTTQVRGQQPFASVPGPEDADFVLQALLSGYLKWLTPAEAEQQRLAALKKKNIVPPIVEDHCTITMQNIFKDIKRRRKRSRNKSTSDRNDDPPADLTLSLFSIFVVNLYVRIFHVVKSSTPSVDLGIQRWLTRYKHGYPLLFNEFSPKMIKRDPGSRMLEDDIAIVTDEIMSSHFSYSHADIGRNFVKIRSIYEMDHLDFVGSTAVSTPARFVRRQNPVQAGVELALILAQRRALGATSDYISTAPIAIAHHANIIEKLAGVSCKGLSFSPCLKLISPELTFGPDGKPSSPEDIWRSLQIYSWAINSKLPKLIDDELTKSGKHLPGFKPIPAKLVTKNSISRLSTLIGHPLDPIIESLITRDTLPIQNMTARLQNRSDRDYKESPDAGKSDTANTVKNTVESDYLILEIIKNYIKFINQHQTSLFIDRYSLAAQSQCIWFKLSERSLNLYHGTTPADRVLQWQMQAAMCTFNVFAKCVIYKEQRNPAHFQELILRLTKHVAGVADFL